MPIVSSPTNSPAPLQRSRALNASTGRTPPASARNMSAPAADVHGDSKDDGLKPVSAIDNHAYILKMKATPPPTPPRTINTPNILSPGCSSPNPLASSAPVKPSPIPTTLKVTSKPTPPATPPRPNVLAATSPATPNFLSPTPVSLSASTPINTHPSKTATSRTEAVCSPHLASPLLTRRAHALAASSRTADVVCTPPRVNVHAATPDAPRRKLSESCADVPPSSPAPTHNHIFSLKSSISIVKSPRIGRDYLLEKLASKPDAPLTRSKSPPPRSPCDSPAYCDSPGRVRKLSEPVPVQYDHLRREVLKGSCDEISMPYNVTHTTHIDTATMRMSDGGNVLVINSSAPVYEKAGYMHKLVGSSFKERWFECRKSTLAYYSKKSSKPRREIHLNDCEFSRDKASKRPLTIHLVHTPTKKHYYLAAPDPTAFEEWIRVFHSSGAIDKDFVVMEKDQKEKERKQEEARKAREQKKQEDEYVKAKMQKRSTLKITNKNMSDCAMESCLCSLAVKEVVERDNGQEFKISVNFDDQTWTIYRNFDKVAKMYDAMTKLKFVKGMCPPKRCPSNMKEAEFTQLQISKLQNLLDLLAKNRPCVLASATPRQRFLRFIAPVGWDDVKLGEFVMPFQFDF